MKTIYQNAVLLPDSGFTEPVCIAVENGKIQAIGPNLPVGQTDEVVDCGGNLMLPAFYNAHCHASMTIFRGYGEDLPLQQWLEQKIFPAEDRLSAHSTYYAAKWAMMEMLKNGIASFSDMYMFEDAVAKAVLETGMKANLSRSLVSFDDAADVHTDSRFAEAKRLVEDFHNAGEGRLKIDMSLHAEYTNVPHYCATVADYTVQKGLRMQIHLSETQKEHNDCITRHGKTPSAFFRDVGVFDAPTTAAHCVWVTDDDIAILRDKRVVVAHNPVSNLKLGSGVMPLKKLLDAGVTVALGTDGVASNNRLDILREMQTAAILHKGVQRNPAVVTAQQMLPLCAENGALAQGRTDCGRLQVGYCADMVLLNRHSVHNIPSYDDRALVMYSADSSDVMMTVVDGRILYRNGEYTSIDEERLRFECRQMFAHYFE